MLPQGKVGIETTKIPPARRQRASKQISPLEIGIAQQWLHLPSNCRRPESKYDIVPAAKEQIFHDLSSCALTQKSLRLVPVIACGSSAGTSNAAVDLLGAVLDPRRSSAGTRDAGGVALLVPGNASCGSTGTGNAFSRATVPVRPSLCRLVPGNAASCGPDWTG